MISWISFSPLSHILSVANEKYSSGRKKSPPSRHRSTVLKKTIHSLQVKGLYHRAGTDHLKRLKIKNQLRKWLKRTIVTAEGGSPPFFSFFFFFFFFGGGGPGTCSPREILKIYAPNESIEGYSTSFHKFFFHLLKSKNFSRL